MGCAGLLYISLLGFKATIWIVLVCGPYNGRLFNSKIQLCLIQTKLAWLVLLNAGVRNLQYECHSYWDGWVISKNQNTMAIAYYVSLHQSILAMSPDLFSPTTKANGKKRSGNTRLLLMCGYARSSVYNQVSWCEHGYSSTQLSLLCGLHHPLTILHVVLKPMMFKWKINNFL